MNPKESETLAEIRAKIKADPANRAYTEAGIDPLFSAPATAKILLIGQAPGIKAQLSAMAWRDASGDRLRQWLAVDDFAFYDSGNFAILPMDFYYPGKGRSGDKPPRTEFAKKWHPLIRTQLPQIKLTILIGRYAEKFYLKQTAKRTLTETVHAYSAYLPDYFPIVHPSPLNGRWLARNPWFTTTVIPALQRQVKRSLD